MGEYLPDDIVEGHGHAALLEPVFQSLPEPEQEWIRGLQGALAAGEEIDFDLQIEMALDAIHVELQNITIED